MQTSTLDKKTLMKIANEIALKFGKHFTSDQLKAKWNRLRRSTREFKALIETTGFGWDSEANTVTAENEVWDSYVVKHPEAKKFKKGDLQNFSQLSQIIFGTIATRQGSMNAHTAVNVLNAARRAATRDSDEVRVQKTIETDGLRVLLLDPRRRARTTVQLTRL